MYDMDIRMGTGGGLCADIAELCYFLSGRSETVHGVADEGLIKVGARVSYHARRWYVHVASAFPLAQHFRVVLDWGP
jgi:hypothetical protein